MILLLFSWEDAFLAKDGYQSLQGANEGATKIQLFN